MRAIKVFLNGLEMADRYEQQWKHSLPLQNELARSQGLKKDQMYAHELSRLKSQFLNNISSAYMALGDYDKAD